MDDLYQKKAIPDPGRCQWCFHYINGWCRAFQENVVRRTSPACLTARAEVARMKQAMDAIRWIGETKPRIFSDGARWYVGPMASAPVFLDAVLAAMRAEKEGHETAVAP